MELSPIFSQSVQLASVTKLNLASRAPIYIKVAIPATLVANAESSRLLPHLVIANMSGSQVLDSVFNSVSPRDESCCCVNRGLSINNLIRTLQKTLLIPHGTLAVLPFQSTNVAPFRFARAASKISKSRNRIERVTNVI